MPRFIGTACALALLSTQPASAGEVIVSGTGIALEAMRIVGKELGESRPDITLTVLPSMGSGGGLKALADGVLDLSLSARRLKPSEESAGLADQVCMATPLVFAALPHHEADFSISDLPGLYDNPDPHWPDGTPLRVILRAESGSEMPYLASKVPGLKEAFEQSRARPDTVVGITDQLNADIAQRMNGALAIASLLQINTEQLRLAPVRIDGIQPSPETLKDGTYPFSMTICVVGKSDHMSADAADVVEFLNSPDGEAAILSTGALPVGR